MNPQRSALLFYCLLLTLATLSPWSGWRDMGTNPRDFILAPWPQYWTWQDLSANTLAYVPFGSLTWLCLPRNRPWVRASLAVMAGFSLSLTLEILQNYLPERVPSNVDVGANALGALLGAGILFLASRHFPQNWRFWENTQGFASPQHSVHIAMLSLWITAQAAPNPQWMHFGDLSLPNWHFVDKLPGWINFVLNSNVFAEGAGVCFSIIGAGLLLSQCFQSANAKNHALVGLVIVAVAIRELSTSIMGGGATLFVWFNAGAQGGLLVGTLILMVLNSLSERSRSVGILISAAAQIILANSNPAVETSPPGEAVQLSGAWIHGRNVATLAAVLWPWALLALAVRNLVFRPPRGSI